MIWVCIQKLIINNILGVSSYLMYYRKEILGSSVSLRAISFHDIIAMILKIKGPDVIIRL